MDNPPVPLVKEAKAKTIESIVINANVTVVLTNFADHGIRVTGDESMIRQIRIRQTGNKLVIDAPARKNFVKKIVIYVPATHLSQIQVNSAAHIHSSGILENPRLNIRINGTCKIRVANSGELNLTGNDFYEFKLEETDVWMGERVSRRK